MTESCSSFLGEMSPALWLLGNDRADDDDDDDDDVDRIGS